MPPAYVPPVKPTENPANEAKPANTKQGRPRKYASDEERKAARRERDRKARAAKRARPATATAKGGDALQAAADEIEELRKGYADAPEQGADPDPAKAASVTPEPPKRAALSGAVLLIGTDALFPPLIGRIMGRDPERMRMTNEERKRMEPIADEAAAEMFGQMSPVSQFVMGMAAIYAGKAQALPRLPRNAKRNA